MKYPYEQLSDQQVKENFFKASDEVAAILFGDTLMLEIECERKQVRAQGGELDFVAWPDKLIFTHKRLDKNKDIDLDQLLIEYRIIAKIREKIELSGGKNES